MTYRTSPDAPTIDTARHAERRRREEYALLHAVAIAVEAYLAASPGVTRDTLAATLTTWRSWQGGRRSGA